MLQHVKILGILFLARGILAILLGALGLLFFGMETFVTPTFHGMAILSIIIKIIIAATMFRGLLEIVCGAGILSLKKWSRPFGMIVAIINLFFVPIGAALGVYGLWVLLKPETESLLTA